MHASTSPPPTDLVDILSKGRNPPSVQEHFSKFTDCTGSIVWDVDENGKETGLALGCKANDKEHVQYAASFQCEGQVEDWLNGLMAHQQEMLKQKLYECVNAYVEMPREKWVNSFFAQIAITTSQIWWTYEVNGSFERLEQGQENAMKEYLSGTVLKGIETYSNMVLGELTKEQRVKIKTGITIDVHARDIVTRLIDTKVDNSQAFM